MCGIAGILADGGLAPGLVEQILAPIAHRGPDDHGIWTDESAGIGLGHRRLSIIDLSPAGHEPMHSASGRFVITFNGEIYNHDEFAQSAGGTGRGSARRLARSFRRRGVSRGHRRLGVDRDAAAKRRHVRLWLMGPQAAHSQPGARPVRRKAAYITAGRERTCCSGPSSRSCARTRASAAPSTAGRSSCSPRGLTFRRRCRSTKACSSCRRAVS